MSYIQFVYDTPAKKTDPPKIPAECVVHFRPITKWEGKNFGFDWLRVGKQGQTGDTGLFGDEHYAKIMGKYKTSMNEVCNDLNGWENFTYLDKNGKQQTKTCSFKNSVEDNDITNYQSLINEYFPIAYNIPWKMPDSKKTPKKGWKFEAEKTDYTYYVPVMTLQKGKTAKLNLYVEVESKKTPPKRIDVKQHTNDSTYFTITGTVKPQKGTYPISVDCTSEFSEFQYIDAVAIYDDPASGKEIEKLCGQLRVVPNDQKIEAKIALIKVTIDIGNGNTEGKINEESIDELDKLLLQSYTIKKISNDSFTLTNVQKLRGLIKKTGDKFNFRKADGLGEFLLSEFKQDLLTKKADSTKYDDYIKIFFMEEYCKNEVEKPDGTTSVTGLNGSTVYDKKDDETGKNIKLKTIVIFKPIDDRKETLAHEVFHALSLQHTFVSKDGTPEAPKALYTYEAKKTENILDYSHQDKKPRYSMWYWQWRIIWEELGISIPHEI